MTDSNITPLPRLAEIETEAAEWAIRLDNDAVPQSVFEEFERWRAQSPLHREVAERFEDFWAGMLDLDAFNDLAETEAVAGPRRLDLAEKSFFSRSGAFIGGAAAAVVALCGFGAYQYYRIEPPFHAEHHTAVGEQETIELPDGSRVVLNTDSAFDADFSKSRRLIRLTKGEAYFDVEPDMSRPFSVQTDVGTVTAVGTAFSVRINDENIGVLVSKGKVALSAPSSSTTRASTGSASAESRPQVVEVSAGQSAIFNQQVETLDALAPEDMVRRLDWQDGLLSFHGEPLSQVVSEISRYTDVNIEIADPALAERRIVAYYEVGKIEPMFEALRITANVQVEWVDARHVRLFASH